MKPSRSLLVVLGAMVASVQSLQEPAYRELPMGSIKSAGWIDAELQISLAGQAGQLQTFYDNIQNGTFTGGSASYDALNEAQPYYFQAAVAAYFTTDVPATLRHWVDETLQYLLSHQDGRGWFGPKPDILWPRWPVLLGLMHFAEGTSDPKQAQSIVDFMYNFVNASHAMLATGDTGSDDPTDGGKSGLEEWGSVRSAEYTMLLQWLYEYHPRDNTTQAVLLNDMTVVRTLGNKKIGDFGKQGWTGFFQPSNFNKDGNGPRNIRSHGVNVAMALKEAALKWRISGSDADRAETRTSWDIVYKYHAKAAGHFAADEHLAGFSPDRGAETCQVVENIWSSSVTYATFAANEDADRAERLAFNSLPAAMTPDWWGRQYLQQEVQLSSIAFQTNPFASDGPESNVFGFVTNYPCCTVNHPQGLPRFISRAYLLQNRGKPGETLLHAYLIPTQVTTTLSGGNKVVVSADTKYPFEDVIRYTFTADQPFTFAARVPGWAKSAVLVSGQGQQATAQDSTPGFVSIAVPAGTSHATYTVTSDIVTTQTPGGNANSVSISKGALLYALPLNFTLAQLRKNNDEPKAIDNLRIPTDANAWKVAIDPTSAQFTQLPVDVPTFDVGKSSVAIRASACRVYKGWNPIDDGAWNKGFPPAKVQCDDKSRFAVTLEPYGAAKLRLATFAALEPASADVAQEEETGEDFLRSLRAILSPNNKQRPFAFGGLRG